MLNAGSQQTLVSHLGIEFIEVGPDFLRAKMPVDERTIQPFGLLHGGASLALAETVGSVASSLQIDLNEQICVGMEINANHVRSVRSGYVYGTARPIHLGRKTHIWEIKITDDAENLVSVSRLTMMILDK
jgi:1,4-dihydroxy-2-naphthoyl-CoA hydrolase